MDEVSQNIWGNSEYNVQLKQNLFQATMFLARESLFKDVYITMFSSSNTHTLSPIFPTLECIRKELVLLLLR